MEPLETAVAADWLGLCRRSVEGLRSMLDAYPTTAERAREIGSLGKGGDRTLVIDEAAEELIFDELDRLHDGGQGFVAVSEERGEVDYGDPGVRVVIDPIDGSMNAKRGLSPYAVSIAVADGPTMADVAFGYVFDFGRGEEWSARRGEGAWLDGRLLGPAPPERRVRDGRLELLAIESADPRWVAAGIEGLERTAHRLRAIGSIAVALCQVAATRVDGMVTLWRARAVDAAAAQLIVRESGGVVAFGNLDTPLAAPLDLVPRPGLAAARSPEALAELLTVSRSSE